jgi:predicted amidohydrolase YtcJ
VGTNADVRRLGRPATREIALSGRVVILGINDAHDHLGAVPVGVDIHTSASPTPDPSAAEVIDSVRARPRQALLACSTETHQFRPQRIAPQASVTQEGP